jgi:hypothetical protein
LFIVDIPRRLAAKADLSRLRREAVGGSTFFGPAEKGALSICFAPPTSSVRAANNMRLEAEIWSGYIEVGETSERSRRDWIGAIAIRH